MTYKDISLTWRGDLDSISGPAQYARALLRPLIEGGADVKLEPMRSGYPVIDLDPFWVEHLKKQDSFPRAMNIFSGHPMSGPNPLKGVPNILVGSWDTMDTPISWRTYIETKYSSIILPDYKFNNHTTDKPKDIVPFPIDVDDYKDIIPSELSGISEDTTVFGFVGAWSNKNNIANLVNAFCCAFNEQDNVVLVLKTILSNNDNVNERAKVLQAVQEIKKLINKPNLPRILVIQDPLGYEALDRLLARIDCYVSAARGSSRNICVLKSLAMGNHVVIPRSANSKSITQCSKLIVYSDSKEPVTQMGNLYTPDDLWADADTYELMNSMRQALARIRLGKNDLKVSSKNKNAQVLNSNHKPSVVLNSFFKALDRYTRVKPSAIKI